LTSPIKSLSIREGVDGSLGIHKKVEPGLYNNVADFWFEICVFVKCEGELNSCSGYILNVHKVQERDVYQSKFIMLDQCGLDYRILSLCNLYTPSSHLKTLTIASNMSYIIASFLKSMCLCNKE
jgi:hypothetical protein